MAKPIEFRLFAPYNEKVLLLGSFSHWQEISMEKREDGSFYATVDLEDGVYEYKFRVASNSWFIENKQLVDVTDPYASDINGNSAEENAIIKIKDGQVVVDDYVWHHDDKPLPGDHEMVIYEMHVADFSGGESDEDPRGKFHHVTEKLDYICDLGINAIELMPIKEYPGDYSWGYNPRHYFAPESSYGSTQELKQLIDECHARGIRIIIDGVYNHSESSAPLTQIDHDYWYYHEPKNPEENWGPEFNYEYYDDNLGTYPARRFIGDSIKFWIEEYHIDGVRYDAAKYVDNYDFMKWIVEESKKSAGAKPFYSVAEYIPETPAITNLEGPMDGCWQDSFYHTVKDHITGETFDLEALKNVIDPKRRGFMGLTNIVNYLTNHDHNHLMADLGDRGIFDEEAFRRRKLGAVLVMTAVGIPMIWMGEEFGEYKYKTIEQAKIDWNLLSNELNQGLFKYYKGLIYLRKTNHALQTPNIDFFHENPEAKVFAYNRWNDEGSRVVVVVNLSQDFLGGYTLNNFPADGPWHEWTTDYHVESANGELMLDIGPLEAKVFVWQG